MRRRFAFFVFFFLLTGFTAAVADSDMQNAVVNVANTAGRAVVSISSEQTHKIPGVKRYYFGGSPFGGSLSPEEDEFFRRFFGDFFGNIPDREFKQRGLGSGVVIDKEGYILTNEHVVGNADKITVTLADGREFKAEIKGVDSRSDLAVIKINAANLPIAALGNSDNLKIGEWAVAIGNPFGFAMQNPEPTVTVGVISALHRTLKINLSENKDYNDLIQTDAAINPGNSGGPLVNLNGEIIGINVAIFSTSGGYQGLGFAIPVNNAKRIISRLIEGKKIVYGWIGVSVQDLTDDLADYFGLADKKGVLVGKVLENGPADKGGIKEKDIIKKLDDVPVNNVRELLNIVGKSQSGHKLKINLIRDRKIMNIEVSVGQRPDTSDEETNNELPEQGTTQSSIWRGLTVRELNKETMKRFVIIEQKGVIIVDIESESSSDTSGLDVGDIILEINKRPINNLSDYQSAVKAIKEDCLVKTQRGYFLLKK